MGNFSYLGLAGGKPNQLAEKQKLGEKLWRWLEEETQKYL